MCTFSEPDAVRELEQKAKKTGGWVACWKEYDEMHDGLYPPYNYCNKRIPLEVSNEVRSNARKTAVNGRYRTRMVNRGIHVVSKKPHKSFIKVWGHIDDLIGAEGTGWNPPDYVFLKVYIDERDYKKLLSKYHPDMEVV